MQIKTIKKCLTEKFDEAVNQALKEGWILKERYHDVDGFIAEMVKDEPTELEIKIKYFTEIDDDFKEIRAITNGDWIDLRASEDIELKKGESIRIPLGVGMILPADYEAHIVVRSSTYESDGIMQTNPHAVIDNSYSGDNDEWKLPVVAMRDTKIDRGDRICQFRVAKKMPEIKITRVDHLNESSRGGFGSTGKR